MSVEYINTKDTESSSIVSTLDVASAVLVDGPAIASIKIFSMQSSQPLTTMSNNTPIIASAATTTSGSTEAASGGANLCQLLTNVGVDSEDNERDIDWILVSERLAAHPEEAAMQSKKGFYPLHEALKQEHVPASVVRALIDAHPDAMQDAIVEPPPPQQPQMVVLTSTDGVTRRFSRSPSIIAVPFVVGGGRSALQFACQNSSTSTSVLHMLLAENPTSVRVKSKLGKILLHFVSTPEAARIIIDQYPEGLLVSDHRGCSPLYEAAARAKWDVVMVLIEESTKRNVDGMGGKLILRLLDKFGSSALDLVCRRFASDLGVEDDWYSDSDTESAAACSSSSKFDWSLQPLERYDACKWRVIKELVTSEYPDYPVLHGVILTECHPLVIWYALRTHPDQVRRKGGEDESTPLCLAALTNPEKCPNKVFEMLLTSDYGDRSVTSMADAKGRLPLHIAAEAGRKFDEGIGALVDAGPEALDTRDTVTHMFPFMLAAVGNRGSLDTVYGLLREGPAVLKVYIPGVLPH